MKSAASWKLVEGDERLTGEGEVKKSVNGSEEIPLKQAAD